MTGLDCLGVVEVAFGKTLDARYPQRGGAIDMVTAAVRTAGFRPIGMDEAGAGDLLLVATAPVQWHFLVLTNIGFVHADARLRRVTEVPGPPVWPVKGAWRDDKGD